MEGVSSLCSHCYNPFISCSDWCARCSRKDIRRCHHKGCDRPLRFSLDYKVHFSRLLHNLFLQNVVIIFQDVWHRFYQSFNSLSSSDAALTVEHGNVKHTITPFQYVLFSKMMRKVLCSTEFCHISFIFQDKLTLALKGFVASQLGANFIRLPPLDVHQVQLSALSFICFLPSDCKIMDSCNLQVYADSLPTLPVIWVLSAGANPVSYITALAEQRY